MFPDSQYYVTLMHGGSCMAVIVRGMDTIEFFTLFRERFNRFPYILSLVPLDYEEFEEFIEVFEENGNDDLIFDNGEQE